MHCKSYSHFFSKKFQHICISLDVNFNKSLTNDIVSFEQLGPGNIELVQEEKNWYTFRESYSVEMFLSEKGSTPLGANSFRVDPFHKGHGVEEINQEDSRAATLVLNGRESVKCIQGL